MPDLLIAAEADVTRRLFSRRSRLTKAAEYQSVFAAPCRLSGRHFLLLVIPNALSQARLGLSISRKHVKRSVARSRIKRQIRESFRMHQDEIAGFDVVVLARPGLDGLDSRTFRASLERLWQELPQRCRKS